MSPFVDYVQNIIDNRKTIKRTELADNKQVEIEVRFSRSNLDYKRVQALFNGYDKSTEKKTTEHSLGTKGVVRKRYVQETGDMEAKESICSNSFGLFSVHSTIETTHKEVLAKSQFDSDPRKKRRRSKTVDGYRIDVTRVTMSGKSGWELEIEILSDSIDVPAFERVVIDLARKTTIARTTPQAVPVVAFAPVVVADGIVSGWTKPKDAYVHDFTGSRRGMFATPVYVTAKLDGVRCIVWIDNGNMYKGSERECMHFVGRVDGPDCVLDCESYGRRIYPFDLLSVRGQNVADRRFIWRLRQLIQICMECRFGHKPQYLATNHDDLVKCIDAIDRHADERSLITDGYIFTPINGKYTTQPYKWKDVPTVDVDVVDKVAYARKGSVNVALPYAVFGAEKDGIYECTIDASTLTLSVLKKRFDKTRPNSTVLAKHMMHAHERNTILHRDGLLGRNHQLYTAYHNRFKRNVLSKCSGVLLDVGSGVGGDLGKWHGCSRVHAVEPSRPSYDELVKRIGHERGRVTPHNCRGEDFDVSSVTDIEMVSMFFVLNVMTIEKFSRMLRNFSEHRSSFAAGKITIALTFMDCTDIDAMMSARRTDVLDFGFARIRREGDETVTTIVDTRVIELAETRIRLVDFEDCVERRGYKIRRCRRLDDETVLSADQRTVSSFYRYAVLEKT